MNRLQATLRLDFTLQRRNQLYSITAAVAVILVFLLWQVFPPRVHAIALPALIFFNQAIYYFFGASMLVLERGQHTLAGQIVTPLRPAEYLSAKVLSLALLALLESLAIVLLVAGVAVNLLPLLAGMLALACLYILVGLAIVVRYQSITDFLMPSILYITLLQLPGLAVFGIWESPLFYAHPLHGPLLLLYGGFHALAPWQVGYGLLAAVVWVGVAFWWSRRAFEQFVIQNGG